PASVVVFTARYRRQVEVDFEIDAVATAPRGVLPAFGGPLPVLALDAPKRRTRLIEIAMGSCERFLFAQRPAKRCLHGRIRCRTENVRDTLSCLQRIKAPNGIAGVEIGMHSAFGTFARIERYVIGPNPVQGRSIVVLTSRFFRAARSGAIGCAPHMNRP